MRFYFTSWNFHQNSTFLPSLGTKITHKITILDGYTESGIGAIKVEDQNIQTLKLRTAMGVVDDLLNESTFCPGVKNETCFIKRHGKIEYMADLSRSSNFKFIYLEKKEIVKEDVVYKLITSLFLQIEKLSSIKFKETSIYHHR